MLIEVIFCREAKVVDSWVQRFPGAVSWFSPGSYTKRPCTVVDGVDNLFCAGDWVIMGSREGIRDASRQKTGDPGVISSSVFPEEHGAKGLCQERALVSGIHAANQMIKQIDAIPSSSATLKYGKIIPVRKDELQVVIGKTVNQKAASLLKKVGISSFWLR